MSSKATLVGMVSLAVLAISSSPAASDNAWEAEGLESPDPERSIELQASIISIAVDGETVNVAMNGYDPVHMLTTRGELRMGTPSHAATRGVATYWFVDDDNRRAFLEDPARYEPKYGGFCAWGMVSQENPRLPRRVNVAHATAVPPVEEDGVYLVLDEGDEARIFGFLKPRVAYWFLQDTEYFMERANDVWANRRQEALVTWDDVDDRVKALREEQGSLQTQLTEAQTE